jgi:hypothetical protein
MPTVIEPLRADWSSVQAAALLLAGEGRLDEARTTVRAFHHRLCETKVRHPACGSGNFLYVALEHMKRLEGEVLNQMEALGASLSLETEGLTVDPHQFLGLELNPAPPPSPNWCCGSATCNGISAPAAAAARPCPCCATSATSNAATPYSPTSAWNT